MNKRVMASCLLNNELAKTVHDLVSERWDHWDLTPYMVYLVDACDASLLPHLAAQFDIDGLRGFEMAVTEQQQRDIIKRSIELHKYIGTPWAIEEACNTVGFPNIELEEGVTAPGAEPAETDWAQFRVTIEAPEDRVFTANEFRRLRVFIEYYKNARSHLVELRFSTSMSDAIFTDEMKALESIELTGSGFPLRKCGNNLRLRPDGTLRIVSRSI